MAVDTSIYNRIERPNPLAALAQGLQTGGAITQVRNQRAAQDRQNKLMEILATTPKEQLPDALLKAGDIEGYTTLQQANAKAASDTATATTKGLEAAAKRFDLMGQVFGSVRANPTPENASMALDYLGRNGVLTPEAVAQYKAEVAANPGQVGALADQAFRAALSAKDQLGVTATRNTGGTTDTIVTDPVTGETRVVNTVQNTQSPESRASVAVQMRGQNMADARAREAQNAGRVPAGYKQNPDGTLTFIPGGPADPATARRAAPTEFQGKSAIYAARANEANAVLNSLAEAGTTLPSVAKGFAEGIPLLGRALGPAANMVFAGPEEQKIEQAQRDFVNAVLRQESGAAIAESEFNNAKRQYFPQIGDTPEVIAQKARNREVVIEGLSRNAGQAQFTPEVGGVKFLGFE